MGRAIKWLFIAAGIVVAGVAALLVAVMLFVDINDYKDDISAAVAESTGRTFELEGDLELQVFPWIRVGTGRATLGNAPGFSDEPLAAFDAASLSVELLPLLGGRVEVGEAVLDGLKLNLATKASGANNWESLVADSEQPESDAPGDSEPPRVDLNISTLRMTDAEVVYADGGAGATWTVSDLDLNVSNLGGGRTAPIQLGAKINGPDVDLTAAVDGALEADLKAGRYTLADAKVDLSGAGVPGGAAELSLAQLAADLEADTLSIDGLVAAVAGLEARGDLTGKIAGGVRLAGDLDIPRFDPKNVLSAFEVELQTADPNALAAASAAARLDYGPDKSMLESLVLTLDDTKITGRAGLIGERVDFDLALDAIDVDRYLPPSSADDQDESSESGDLDAVDLPIDVIRSTPAKGSLSLGNVQFAGLTYTDMKLAVDNRNGRLTLTPSAQAYQGTYSGTIVIDARPDVAQLSLEQELVGMALGELGRDLSKVEDLTGLVEAKISLAGRGNRVGDQIRTLNGDFALSIQDGTLEGTDLWYELRRARALFKRTDPPAKPDGPPRTPFSEAIASGVVTDGVLQNRNLRALMPFVSLTGEGEINLIESELNYSLVAEVLDRPELANEAEAEDLGGTKVPLKVTGPLADPKIRPDFAALIKAEATKKIQEKLLDTLGLGDEEEGAEGEDKPELKDRLKDLFKR